MLQVALLTECVDRNLVQLRFLRFGQLSHSLRSAWIEMREQYPLTRQGKGRTPYGVRG